MAKREKEQSKNKPEERKFEYFDFGYLFDTAGMEGEARSEEWARLAVASDEGLEERDEFWVGTVIGDDDEDEDIMAEMTPLAWAIANCLPSVARILIDGGADARATVSIMSGGDPNDIDMESLACGWYMGNESDECRQILLAERERLCLASEVRMPTVDEAAPKTTKPI